MWCAASERRICAANVGVPANPIRRRTADGLSGTDATLFFELLPDALALESRQIVDEQLAVEVVALVLNAHRECSLCRKFERHPVPIERTNAHAIGSRDQLIKAG